jgi:hypothetical protein
MHRGSDVEDAGALRRCRPSPSHPPPQTCTSTRGFRLALCLETTSARSSIGLASGVSCFRPPPPTSPPPTPPPPHRCTRASGLPPLEARASGHAVVTSNVSVVARGGRWTRRFSVRPYARRCALVDRPSRRRPHPTRPGPPRCVAKASRRAPRRFSWERSVAKIVGRSIRRWAARPHPTGSRKPSSRSRVGPMTGCARPRLAQPECAAARRCSRGEERVRAHSGTPTIHARSSYHTRLGLTPTIFRDRPIAVRNVVSSAVQSVRQGRTYSRVISRCIPSPTPEAVRSRRLTTFVISSSH